MTAASRRAAAGYLRFLGWAVGLSAVTFALGYLPTRALAGGEGLPAMAVGIAIGFLASSLGAVPVALAAAGERSAGRSPAMTVASAAMALRLMVVLALALPAALSGRLARGPLLVWVAISYIVLLAVDTRYALVALRTSEDRER